MVIGLHFFKSAVTAIAIYYITIICAVLMDSPGRHLKSVFMGWHTKAAIAFLVVTGLVAPAILFHWSRAKLPGIELAHALAQFGINNVAIKFFAVGAVLINPIMEELFWRGCLLEKSSKPSWLDAVFAAYHVPILMLVIRWPFIAGVFVILACTSWAFRYIRLKAGGLLIPWIAHTVADAGIAVAVWMIIG